MALKPDRVPSTQYKELFFFVFFLNVVLVFIFNQDEETEV